MRVLQLIDSLEPGGAERLAVTLANGLQSKVAFSAICATRKEGPFKNNIKKEVPYLLLRKKSAFDFASYFRLRKFIKQHRISIIHAHSSSFFTAFVMRLFGLRVKIIWHDHFGNSEFLHNRKHGALKIASLFFYNTIVVNHNLKVWVEQKLFVKEAILLNNFIPSDTEEIKTTKLQGEKGKRIVCLANLRPQKDHLLLLNAFKTVLESYPDWTLHLLGKDFEDEYSQDINNIVKDLKDKAFVYGSVPDVINTISQAEIGVLSSKSEGLPISLLEYGKSKLAVISTDVGDCKKVIIDHKTGLLVPKEDEKKLSDSLLRLIKDSNLRNDIGNELHRHVIANFSEQAVLDKVINIYAKKTI
ncbi:glycosyltransferase family 4 protein [Pseudofulvibacter geojedonensis]|uniref:Glycosyltransferase family 4 protein n=1 Tax=Pseudofulvibacter geojedonensis TaxID=1123758 RepID=A0ABW3HYF9_9FLAO